MNVQNPNAIALKLEREANEKFGEERAAELREAITQMAKELYAIQAHPVSPDDEP
jgi:hypothetical protein